MYKYKLNFISKLFFASLILVNFASCQDELFTSDPDKKLSFSTDTLTFDTIFTSFGSTTEKFLIYNNNNRALRISQINLAKGSNSNFRLNVDGLLNAQNKFTDIEIGARDSMYVFIETTINATNDNNPMLIEDSVTFILNGNKQYVLLEAFGQNVILLKDVRITKDTNFEIEKPYLIYGNLLVDSAKTLTLPAGCRLYFHKNSNLIVYGNLRSEGTFDQPVELRGDRLDKVKFLDPVPYSFYPGQWGGIYLLWNQGKHYFKNTNIISGNVGLYSPNTDRNNLPEIEVENCRIHNFSYYGIVAQNTNLTVKNSEISNTGSYTVFLSGGTHIFKQSSIVNLFNSRSKDKNPAVMIMGLDRIAPMQTEFINCIITGNQANEFAIASRFLKDYKGVFANSYIKRQSKYDQIQFQKIRWYQPMDSTFDYLNIKRFIFTPDSLSPARGIADLATASQFPLDLKGKSRFSDNAPDAGCYEWRTYNQE
jgi:hypothetical protein